MASFSFDCLPEHIAMLNYDQNFLLLVMADFRIKLPLKLTLHRAYLKLTEHLYFKPYGTNSADYSNFKSLILGDFEYFDYVYTD